MEEQTSPREKAINDLAGALLHTAATVMSAWSPDNNADGLEMTAEAFARAIAMISEDLHPPFAALVLQKVAPTVMK